MSTIMRTGGGSSTKVFVNGEKSSAKVVNITKTDGVWSTLCNSPISSTYDSYIYASDEYIYVINGNNYRKPLNGTTWTKISMSNKFAQGTYAGNGVFYFTDNYKWVEGVGTAITTIPSISAVSVSMCNGDLYGGTVTSYGTEAYTGGKLYDAYLYKFINNAWSQTSYTVRCNKGGGVLTFMAGCKNSEHLFLFFKWASTGPYNVYLVGQSINQQISISSSMPSQSGMAVDNDDYFHVFGYYTSGKTHVKVNTNGTTTSLKNLPFSFWGTGPTIAALAGDGSILGINGANSYTGTWQSVYDVPIVKFGPSYDVTFN